MIRPLKGFKAKDIIDTKCVGCIEHYNTAKRFIMPSDHVEWSCGNCRNTFKIYGIEFLHDGIIDSGFTIRNQDKVFRIFIFWENMCT